MWKSRIQEQHIIQLIKVHYGIDIQVMHFLASSADTNALVYKADAKSKSYFIKIKYGLQDEINLSIIRLLHEIGINEIILPVQTLDEKLFKQLDQFNIIAYPFIDASDGFTRDLTENQWNQLGKAFRKIHGTSVPVSIQQQLKKETYPTKWREIVKSFYNKIKIEASDDKITAEFKSYFENNIDLIYQLINSTEDLSKKIRPDIKKYVLCHSDIHAGNVLVTRDNSIYIIDWDEPMMAPRERDLMFIGGGVGNVWNKSEEISYFYAGYGDTNIDKTILSYYRHARIVEDIALYGQDLLSHDHSDQSRHVMLKRFKAMFDPNGVVKIAFATKPT